jgi:hypothetical protein
MIIDKFTIHTQDSIAEARDKLTYQIDDAPSPFEINSTRDILCGEVTENTFRLIRVKGRGQSLIFISGWFETIQTGTIVHLTAELNSTLVIAYLLFSLQLVFQVCQARTKHTSSFLCLAIGMITIFTVASIRSFKNDIKFYPKKLSQVFLQPLKEQN